MANVSILSVTPIPAVFASQIQASVDLGTGPGRAVLVLAFLDSTDPTQVITGATAGGMAMNGGATYSRYGAGSTNTHRLFTLASGSLPTGTQTVRVTANNANRKPAAVVVVVQDADGGDLTFGTETPAYSAFGITATSGAVPSTAGDFVVALARRDGSVGAAGTGSGGTTARPTVNCTSYQCDAWHETATGSSTTMDVTYTTPSARSDVVSIAITSSAGGGGGTTTAQADLVGSYEILAGAAAAQADLGGAFQVLGKASADLAGFFQILGATPSVTAGPFKNGTGQLLPALLVENVAVLKSSDRTVVVEATNVTTDASGNLTITSAALVAGTKYQVASWNADGSIGGIKQATAA